jgi:hypothetical protein
LFFLDLPVEECIAGVEKRIGKKRDDMPWIEECFDPEFRRWIIDFPVREYGKIKSIIEKYSYKNIIVFKSRTEIDKYLEDITDETGTHKKGELQAIPKATYENPESAEVKKGMAYGNGTKNPIFAYGIAQTGSGYVETAQLK